MRILIFSDTHLTDKLEPAKLEYLTRIISEADRVIINGDFWDYYLTEWDEFLNSTWKLLFPLLKSKYTIYIYGNHDQQYHSDDRVNLFSTHQTHRLNMKIGDKKFRIEHGHLIIPSLEEVHPYLNNKLMIQIGSEFELIGAKVAGKQFFKKAYESENINLKTYIKNNMPEDEILICGHTHLAEFDLKKRFINSGILKYGYGQYVIINDGTPHLIDETY